MPKKFFDIIPPNQTKPKELSEEIQREVQPFHGGPTSVKSMKFRKWFFGIIGSVIVILTFLLLGSFAFSEVDIAIWPEIDELSFNETITIDLNTTSVDFENNAIPGQEVTNEKVESKEFSATGKAVKESKARGTITVYNAHSTSARSLVPSRFVSADGKLFWSTKKISVPGYKMQGGKKVPGEVQVEVEAAEVGPDYNIGATTFALPGLAGTALYTTIYAKSFDSMTGGYVGEVNQIVQNDLNNAETELTEKVKSDSRNILKASLPSDIMLPDETIIQEVVESNFSHSLGFEIDSFSYEVKVRSAGLAFKKSDVEGIVMNRINSEIDDGEKIKDGSLEIKYKLKEVDLKNGKIVVELDIKVKKYTEINLDEIKKAVLGKTVQEATFLLQTLTQVERVELDKGSFMRKTIPDSMDKVKVELILD